MATLWPRLAEWVKTAGLFAVHFNRIGCRLHNLQAYFTCAQPPIRPYSAQLLSRFSPSPFPPSLHPSTPFSAVHTTSLWARYTPPPPDENPFRGSPIPHEKCLRANASPWFIPTGSLSKTYLQRRHSIPSSWQDRFLTDRSRHLCDNYGSGGVVFSSLNRCSSLGIFRNICNRIIYRIIYILKFRISLSFEDEIWLD